MWSRNVHIRFSALFCVFRFRFQKRELSVIRRWSNGMSLMELGPHSDAPSAPFGSLVLPGGLDLSSRCSASQSAVNCHRTIDLGDWDLVLGLHVLLHQFRLLDCRGKRGSGKGNRGASRD